MAAEKDAILSIPKFDGDYEYWAMLMENLIRSKEWWHLVETGYTEPERGEILNGAQKKELADLKLKDLKVKNYLFQAIDKTTLKTITQKDTAKQLWESMKTRFQGDEKVRNAQLQTLRRDFEILEMKIGESITDYFSRVVLVCNNMSNLGEGLEDAKIVEKILRTLPESWNFVVCSIEESKDIKSLSVNQLRSSLLVHEQKFQKRKSTDEEQALKVSYEGGRGRGNRGGFRGRGRGRGRQTFNRATIECFRCHKLGHFQYECPGTEKEANYANIDGGETLLLMSHVEVTENYARGSAMELSYEEELALMAQAEANGVSRTEAWFVDSGCSNHMCGDKKMFSNFDGEFRHFVKLGNNTKMNVEGKGSVQLSINGVKHVVTEVYYVPDLKNNLLSVGQWQEKGLAILMHEGKCRIYHPRRGLIIETTMTANRMFVIMARAIATPTSCFLTSTLDLPQLWHSRYGHLSYKGLKILQSKNMVHGLPKFDVAKKECIDCLIGKQHRNSFSKKSTWRAKQRLELVHADLCGPITPESNSSKRYILCFIDDFSRRAWTFYLTNKADTFNSFVAFKRNVEKETGISIKCLRTDRDGEFNSNEFNEFCKENGIKRQLTAAYSPQQNGVAERKNRTILNMVRSMLSEKKMPKTFWPEAVNWTTFVLNRCPTSAVKDMTPQEAWSGEKPSVEFFRIFGCIAFVHVPEARRTKLEDRSVPCVLLGVSEESKAYRLYNPITKRIVISRDVVFEEKKEWDWDISYEQQVSMELEWGEDQSVINEIEDEASDGDDEFEDQEAGNSGGGILNSSEAEENVGNSPMGHETPEAREARERGPPAWMSDYTPGSGLSGSGISDLELQANMAVAMSDDPTNFEDAAGSEKWRKAMDAEIESIEKNNTWKLVKLPPGAKRIGVKWVFKTKYNEAGEIDKYKARLVAKGYSQRQGVDFTEVYAPVARMDTIRVMLALVAQRGWIVYQLDVKSAFLHGKLIEDVYVEQPLGYEKKGEEDKVYKLQKALYGLKQAPRAWFSRIDAYFNKEGFQKCGSEQTLFSKAGSGGKILLVSVYVDDLIYTSNDDVMLGEFKTSMMKEFEMTDLGKMRFFLGLEVLQRDDGIFVCQRQYVIEVLRRFGMEESKEVKSPIVPGCRLSKNGGGELVNETYYKQIVESLMYLTASRPDLMFVVSLLSRFMSQPTEMHFQAAKRVMRYLKGTTNYGIFYKKQEYEELVAFTDSDYAGDLDDRKSTSGYVFLIGGSAVSWASKKQPIVTLSTTEAEYVAATSCAQQAIWLKQVLEEMGSKQDGSTVIWCDNSSTIKLSKNPVFHGRSKHIAVRFHFLRNLTHDGVVKLVHCDTSEQLADMFTKPLKLEAFEKLRKLLGVCDLNSIS